MEMARFRCITTAFLFIFLVTAIPLSIIMWQEISIPAEQVYSYQTNGSMTESVKWDDVNRRFIVSSFGGGIGQVYVSDDYGQGALLLTEEKVVNDNGLFGNATLGLVIDRQRNRLVVVSADIVLNSYGAVAAYDLKSWEQLWHTQLTGPGDEKALADDVAIDKDGNAYVTDAKSSKIWKVGVDGVLLSIIRSPLFTFKEWYKNLVALNGIVYHPDGFLLVVHTATGTLYKIDTVTEVVKVVKIVGGGSLTYGDGMELISPNQFVIAGINPSARLVESLDGWKTAKIVAKFLGPLHRVATGVALKDGKTYINHLLGLGFPKKKHVLVEAIFKPVKV